MGSPGGAQARQPHIFLGRSVRVLRDETPDVLDDLLAAGALRVPVDLGNGRNDAVVCCRGCPSRRSSGGSRRGSRV